MAKTLADKLQTLDDHLARGLITRTEWVEAYRAEYQQDKADRQRASHETTSAVVMTDDNRDLAYRLARVELQRSQRAYDEAEPGSADEMVSRMSRDNARALVDSLCTTQDSGRVEALMRATETDGRYSDPYFRQLVVRFSESGDALCATAHTVAAGMYDAATLAASEDRPATARRFRSIADAVTCDDDGCGCK